MAEIYTLYFGTTSGDLSLVAASIEGVTYAVPNIPLAYSTTYYWRVDAINDYGTTTGDEWTWTTIQFQPPSPTYYYADENFWYILLWKTGGVWGDPPPDGVEDVDYTIVANGNMMCTRKLLLACADNAVYFAEV